MGKIAVVTMIRNECDIIELFIKHNLDLVDKIFVIDHFSSDNTPIILDKLRELGLPIETVQAMDVYQNQSNEITTLTRKIAADGEFDHIIPLDADEFLPWMDRRSFRELLKNEIPQDSFGTMYWKTFCPANGETNDQLMSLQSGFFARSHEPIDYPKVILGGKFAKSGTVSAGNHSAKHPYFKRKAIKTSLHLQHLPVRSTPQIVQKALVGSHTLLSSPIRKPGEAFHWIQMADRIREVNYKPSNEVVQEFALAYAVPNDPKNSYKTPSLTANPMQLSPDHKVQFPDLAKINILHSLDYFMKTSFQDQVLIKRQVGIWKFLVEKFLV
jgi:Glycosyl transferase family 2